MFLRLFKTRFYFRLIFYQLSDEEPTKTTLIASNKAMLTLENYGTKKETLGNYRNIKKGLSLNVFYY